MLNIPNDINKGIMMIPKVIETESQYRAALTEVERLIATKPQPGTPDADRLALLATLVEVYENKHYHFELPDPIEAIRFRMEEQGLLQRDLVSFIGSKSKVSEVLSGKRPLTMQMARALHHGLGIPAEVLLQDAKKAQPLEKLESIDWNKFPISEMVKKGWVKTKIRNIEDHAEELMKTFLAPLGESVPEVAICRRTIHQRSNQEPDTYKLRAWTARVLIRAKQEGCGTNYKPEKISNEFIKEVARLSWSEQGPLLAKEFLDKNGIVLIIEKQLQKMKLDGGSMLTDEGRPVIGLTLRFDRLDNFWYTLIHELSHVWKHLKNSETAFVDNTEEEIQEEDQVEKEADKITRETFIPRSIWVRSDALRQQTQEAIKQLAEELRIHPAIVAGRIRRETNNYMILNDLVGQGQVQKLFLE